jgi:hypothetical protein
VPLSPSLPFPLLRPHRENEKTEREREREREEEEIKQQSLPE